MDNYCIAVFDLGKTNKKALIYNQDLELIDEEKTIIEEVDENDCRCEDVEAIKKWFIESLKIFSKKHPIKAISISAHGATFAGIDEDGYMPAPLISYTTEPGEAFHEEFRKEFGNLIDLQQETATADLKALINIAKGIYYLRKQFPDEFNKIKTLLNYPQFYGHFLTGKEGIEKTYQGCHTYLWNVEENRWSSVAEKLGVTHLFPDTFKSPWESIGVIRPAVARKTGLSHDVQVTLGIHDSNAALLPYLIAVKDEFILNSTGTWCVVMQPAERVVFSEEELGKTVFYNISAFEKPVKTAIFMGGEEFSCYSEIFKKVQGEKPYPRFNEAVYQEMVSACNTFIIPSITQGAGQFPESKARVIEDNQVYFYRQVLKGEKRPGFIHDHEKAYAALNLSLALQTQVALERAGLKPGMPIFVEGGFRNNEPYNKLLAALNPQSDVFLTEIKEASAYGAAILGKIMIEGIEPEELEGKIKINFSKVDRPQLDGLEDYRRKFLSFV